MNDKPLFQKIIIAQIIQWLNLIINNLEKYNNTDTVTIDQINTQFNSLLTIKRVLDGDTHFKGYHPK